MNGTFAMGFIVILQTRTAITVTMTDAIMCLGTSNECLPVNTFGSIIRKATERILTLTSMAGRFVMPSSVCCKIRYGVSAILKCKEIERRTFGMGRHTLKRALNCARNVVRVGRVSDARSNARQCSGISAIWHTASASQNIQRQRGSETTAHVVNGSVKLREG